MVLLKALHINMKMFPNCKKKTKQKQNVHCVTAETIHTTSTYDPSSLLDFQNQPPKATPTPLWNF